MPSPFKLRHGPSTIRRSAATAAAFLGIAVIAQWLLLTNPGYFSHDELGWAARADVATIMQLPWVSWTDVGTFQYRPLTFNLWLLLAHALHDSPLLFHALWVALGTAIALGFRSVLQRIGVDSPAATVAALVFLLNPYAVYVHGWVATLADLIWVGAGLLLTLWLQHERADMRATRWLIVAGVVTATVALLAKEAAVVLAPLAWLAWWLSDRQRSWLRVALGLSIPTALYLFLRADVILNAPRADHAYAWSIGSIPATWLKYHLFPYLPTMPELRTVFDAAPARLLFAVALFTGTLIAAFTASWRLGCAVIVGSMLALGPVLLLEAPYNQYGYAMSLIVVAALASCWRRARRPARVALSIAALVCVWHGINVQRAIRHAGDLQAVFTPGLRDIIAASDGDSVRLSPENGSDAWIYQRLVQEASAYGVGNDAGPHVVIVATDEPADLRIAVDGRLFALPGR